MTDRIALLLGLLASLAVLGCAHPEACDEAGVVGLCSCGAGNGARVCSAEREWGACDCSGVIPLPNPITEVDAGGTSGTGGVGGMSGTGGVGGMSGTGGVGGMSGTGGVGGMSGTGGVGGVQPSPYGGCTGATDCPDPNKCFPHPSDATKSFCSAECQFDSECPRPSGSYDAAPDCIAGDQGSYCGLNCTPPGFFDPPRSCPTGTTCVFVNTAYSFCFSDTPTGP